jgi:porin
MIFSFVSCLAGCLVTLVGLQNSLYADDPSVPAASAGSAFDDWVSGKYALGDFGGVRTRLEEKGVDFFAYYTADVAGNPVGGVDPGHLTYTDDFYFGVNLYLSKLLGWTGTSLFINGIRRDGHSLTDKYVGSIYNAQQDYGGENIFLYDVALEQSLFDDKFSIKLGRMSASDDFNNSPLYNLYMTNGIDGDVRNVLFDTQFSAYPFNTWAARTVYYPTKEIAVKLGVFQTTSNVFARSRNGIDWDIRGDDGVYLIGQINWSPEFFERPVPGTGKSGSDGGKAGAITSGTPPEMKGLEGHYNFGGSYSPWKGFTEFGTGRQRASSYGFFAHADQVVYQENPGSKKALTLWAAGAVYPQNDISIVPYQAEGGIVWQGLIPKRDEDKLILGAVYGKFSRNYANLVEDAGKGKAGSESVFEAAYRFQLTKFLFIQPDLQFYLTPFGTGRIDDVFIVGSHTGTVF